MSRWALGRLMVSAPAGPCQPPGAAASAASGWSAHRCGLMTTSRSEAAVLSVPHMSTSAAAAAAVAAMSGRALSSSSCTTSSPLTTLRHSRSSRCGCVGQSCVIPSSLRPQGYAGGAGGSGNVVNSWSSTLHAKNPGAVRTFHSSTPATAPTSGSSSSSSGASSNHHSGGSRGAGHSDGGSKSTHGSGAPGGFPAGSPQGSGHYEVLGVPPDAPLAAIKAAFRQRAKELHPDVLAARTMGRQRHPQPHPHASQQHPQQHPAQRPQQAVQHPQHSASGDPGVDEAT
ncbi:hypothetical protein Agub_g3723, partial [Astrephomene gubernaculifera]